MASVAITLVNPDGREKNPLVLPASSRKRIGLYQTGGTIASVSSSNGIVPSLDVTALLSDPLFSEEIQVVSWPAGSAGGFEKLLPSPYIQPEDWVWMARAIHSHLQGDDIDGMVIIVGTDTLGYGAAALSILFQNPPKPIVFVGAMVPPSERESDAAKNLQDGLVAAALLPGGVYAVFGGTIFFGMDVSKTSSRTRNPYWARSGVVAGGVDVETRSVSLKRSLTKGAEPSLLLTEFDNRVKVEAIVPGYDPLFLERLLLDDSVHGVILEGYGLGHLPMKGARGLWDVLERHTGNKPVIALSHCFDSPVDLTQYEEGVLAAKVGVLSARTLSRECATFLAKVLLARCATVSQFKESWIAIVKEHSEPRGYVALGDVLSMGM